MNKGVRSQRIESNFRQTCQHIVRILLEKNNWTLLSEDELAALVLATTQMEDSPAELERRAKHHYTTVLYETCQQTDDPARRERAYAELHRFLYRAAYNRWPELAEEATQRALILVYEQLDRCRNPGTFLAFALNKLRHAFQQAQRAQGRDRSLEEIGRTAAEEEAVGVQSNLERRELIQVLVKAIQTLPNKNQQRAIVLKFLGGWSDEEIAARLETTPGNVRVLRNRGLKKLREDERLRSYFINPIQKKT